MSVIKFKDVDEVLKRANKSKYGLAAGVYSNDINTVLKLTSGLQAGTVWVNCYGHVTPQGRLSVYKQGIWLTNISFFFVLLMKAPFGGFKQSGFGREM
jgi:acyl-CoA reductase-like NAD-dependent aldehyde dehydrogenase